MWTTVRPRSRTSVLSPFSHNSLPAQPREIPEPTTIASKVVTSDVTEALSYRGRKAGAGDARDERRGQYMWVTFRCNVRALLFLLRRSARGRDFKDYADVVPNHPVPIQLYSAVPLLKRACLVITDVDADAMCPLFEKPSREKAEQLRSDVGSTVFRNDVDPLELAVATEPAAEVSSDVTDRRPTLCGHPHCSRRKRLLWVVFAGQISQHPRVASGL